MTLKRSGSNCLLDIFVIAAIVSLLDFGFHNFVILGIYVRLSFLLKPLVLWQIIILLLPPPVIPSLVSSTGIICQSEGGKKLARHPCGCSLEETGCHACRCINCRGSCCAGVKKKPAPACNSPENVVTACHQAEKKPAVPGIRVVPCGGPEELNLNSFGKVKLILANFLFLPGIPFLPAVLEAREKLENLFCQPVVPPPEISRST